MGSRCHCQVNEAPVQAGRRGGPRSLARRFPRPFTEQMEDHEERARRDLTDRLSRRFETPRDHVQQLVDQGFEGFRAARVRDYIALLVEREVSDVLRRRSRIPTQRPAAEVVVVSVSGP